MSRSSQDSKSGKPYERLAQRIFQAIHDEKAANTIRVQHDVQIEGRTTTHQIDVYWEFLDAGIKHIVCVECKDWQAPVSQGEIIQFKGVLDDIPGQPRGVFISRTGYQSGARSVGEAHGIALFELRQEDGIDTVVIRAQFYSPHAEGFAWIPDETWNISEKRRLGVPDGENITFRIEGMSNEFYFYDSDEREVGTAQDAINAMYPKEYAKLPPTRARHDFRVPTFFRTGDPRFPRIKLTAIEATISVREYVEDIRIEGIARLILRNVLEGTERTFEANENKARVVRSSPTVAE